MSPTDFYNIIKVLPVGQSGFPTKQAMADATGLNIYNVKLFLKGLVNNGKIRMEGNWYKFNEEVLSRKGLETIDTAKANFKKWIVSDPVELNGYIEEINNDNLPLNDKYSIAMPKRFKTKMDSFTILRYVMGIIGISASVMSAYYTQIWQHETLSIFWSWFLSLIMIGFSSTAFLTLIGILTKSLKGNWKNIGIAVIFTVLWIICLIYSVQVTFAGRFNQYQEIVLNNKLRENSSNINRLRVSNLSQSIEELKLENTNNQKQLVILLNQLDYIQVNMGVKGETFQTIQSKISKTQEKISIINDKIESKNIEYEKLLGEVSLNTNEVKFGFYDWAAKIYKTDRGNIEFIFILFPSLFLDIAAPIALAVFMFLGKKKE